MKKRIFGKITAGFVALLLMLWMGVAVYAGSYYDGRDGDISLYLPDGWNFQEIDKTDDADLAYEKILECYDASGETMLHLDLYYMQDETTDGEYFCFDGSEEEAMLYYEQYGMTAIENLYGSISNDASFTVGDAEFWDGEWNGFLVVKVTGNMTPKDGGQSYAFADTVYLTCNMAGTDDIVVHNLLVFYNEDHTAITGKSADVAREVADGFYDYGYSDSQAGVSGSTYSDEWGDDGTDISEIIGAAIPVLGALGVFVLLFVRKRIAAKKRPSDQLTGRLSGTESKKQRRHKTPSKPKADNAKAHDHVREILQINQTYRQKDGKSPAEQKRYLDSESRYLQSLETLQKSGLLTKEEMREMVQRHERSLNSKK